MKIWNPVAFFISLIMSLVMALIFAVPTGMPLWLCVALWPIRWPVAYFFANFICNPLGFKLAVKVFNFQPGQKTGIWNPVPFFISLQMSFIIPLIFGVTTNLPIDQFLLMWPIRWFVAYCLINFIVRPLAFKLAFKVFGFSPENA
ncbi:hypothetical protein [Methanobrevibacter sp.]|uniref:hypothetical protein n=1 Tax=Methanobrevibacter sp. TaxID=66852 RepID=UPI0026E0CC77|nr:hypothetical protein [Methanobrevibacter sp.]MDO5859456.1 hypothetical protein [Methanobrevibacter sp.]